MSFPFRIALLGAVSIALASSADATTLCVDTVPELVHAINGFDLEADGSTLTIKVVQGNYLVNSALVSTPHDAGGNVVGLKLLGGYSAGCASRSINPLNTTIDAGNQANTGLRFYLDANANALIEGISFTRFSPAAGAAVIELIPYHGFNDAETYALRQCRLLRNSGRYGLSISAAQMDVSNNLIVDNTFSGSGAAAVYAGFDYDANSRLSLSNNTIANNPNAAGAVVDTSNRSSVRLSEISNNILWGNGGVDLNLALYSVGANPLPVANGNLYGSVSGIVLPAGNLSANPQFVNAAAGNYAAAAGSPAINSGSPLQIYGYPARDLTGGARIVGSAIDRGAFEASVDDQSTFLVTTTADNGSNTSPTTGSLRAAIKAANASSLPFRINFAISGSCPRIVSLAAPMLDVVGDLTIDGRTQPGWAPNSNYGGFDATLCLVLNGVGSTPYALRVPSSAGNARLVVQGMMFAGFSDAAIKLEGGANHRISGNQFGAVPFTASNHDAIRVTGNSGGAFIGGFDDPAAVNLIAGSSDAGIYLDNASGGSTIGNAVIGYQADGVGDGGNNIGVFIFNSPNNSLLYNYIGYSGGNGVGISGTAATGNLLQYNQIGVTRDGAAAANQGAGVGILFAARNSTVGAPLSGNFGGNVIANNAGPGVWVSPSGGAGNRVLANAMQNNGNVDIDLGSAGPSANQASNPVAGPNQLQNYPQLTLATRSSGASPSVSVSGSLHSAPSSAYRIDVYYAATCDNSAPARGRADLNLGRSTVNTNAAGDAVFSFSLTAPALPLGALAATATSAGGDTSEIGNCVNEVSGSLPNLMFSNGFE